jgi:hypothetical protein
MFHFSRAIYREIADYIDSDVVRQGVPAHAYVLRSCEGTIERLTTDRHYFARPARTLFSEIRSCFPMAQQPRVWAIVERYITAVDQYLARQPLGGQPNSCRATTRRGTNCARTPLHSNGYCPSHQHLVETEEVEARSLAA